ncbi:MAG: hypothetical protein ACQESG_06560 [Nanobdellota archaeon]
MKRLVLLLILCSFVFAIPMDSVNQYYAVEFDGEGEAVISLLIEISEAHNQLSLEVPNNQVTMLGAVQEMQGRTQRICTHWEYRCIKPGEGKTCVQYDYDGNCVKYDGPCLESEKVCANYQTHYNNQVIYDKLNYSIDRLSESTVITLYPAEKENARLMLVYKAPMATKSLGAYKYTFKTAGVPLTTQHLRVAVDVQDDLYMKGTQSHIDYRPNFDLKADSFSAETSQQIYNYQNQIQRSQGVIKTAQYLDPYERYTLNGIYASSWLRLNYGKILGSLVAVAVIGTLMVFGFRKLIHSMEAKKSKSSEYVTPLLAGLFNTIGIMLLWGLGVLIIWLANETMRYDTGEIIAVIIILLEVLITMALLIGLPIIIGVKKGALQGGFTVISELLWLFILSLLIMLVSIIGLLL